MSKRSANRILSDRGKQQRMNVDNEEIGVSLKNYVKTKVLDTDTAGEADIESGVDEGTAVGPSRRDDVKKRLSSIKHSTVRDNEEQSHDGLEDEYCDSFDEYKKRPLFDSSDSECCQTSEEDNSEDGYNYGPVAVDESMQQAADFIKSCLPKDFNFHSKYCKRKLGKPSTSKEAVPTLLPREDQAVCKIKEEHLCCFASGPPTLESIAHVLCKLSSDIEIMTRDKQSIHKELTILRLRAEALKEKRNDLIQSEEDEEENQKALNSIKAMLPIVTKKQFDCFDEQLKDGNFKSNVVKLVLSLGSGTDNLSRNVTPALRYFLSDDIVRLFTYKGQSTRGPKKFPFRGTRFCKSLIGYFSRKWNVEKKHVEKPIASWLAQTESRRKLSTDARTPTAAAKD